MCNGFYGCCFTDPVCETCHAFLYSTVAIKEDFLTVLSEVKCYILVLQFVYLNLHNLGRRWQWFWQWWAFRQCIQIFNTWGAIISISGCSWSEWRRFTSTFKTSCSHTISWQCQHWTFTTRRCWVVFFITWHCYPKIVIFSFNSYIWILRWPFYVECWPSKH